MLRRLAIGFVWCLCGIASVAAQTLALDFEDGLRGWTSSGNAFDAQPVLASSITTDAVKPVRIGGSYWRGLSFPIGQHGRYLIRTPDAGQGTLTSAEFRLRADDHVFSALIGGSADLAHERVELQVRGPFEDAAAKRDGAFVIVAEMTGTGEERLRRIGRDVPVWALGRNARVKIIDSSVAPGAHITVDEVMLSARLPDPVPAPVWGLADLHTHVMTHMGFGGIKGVSTIWGVPGRGYDEYVSTPPSRFPGDDLPQCVDRHGGGPAAAFFINVAEGRFVASWFLPNLIARVTGRITHHGHSGGPDFTDWPSFLSGTHEQMHITQIHRAWEGGLRLMSVLAVHNRGLEYIVSEPKDGHIVPSWDREVLDAQLCGIHQLVNRNTSWIEIAYSPDDARRIIGEGKLAIVLGVEMDELGQLGGFDGNIVDEVNHLWEAGIRQVTPVHAIDNRLGSAAVFQPVYNSLNDLIHRGKMDLTPDELEQWPARFFTIKGATCKPGTPSPARGECVLFRLDDKKQQRVVLEKWFLSDGRVTPFVEEVTAGYGKQDGMVNANGLTIDGAAYIGELMKRGMLIGLEHMSQRTVDDTYRVIGRQLERRNPACAGFGTRDLDQSCYDAAYPLIFSHAHFRELSAPSRHVTKIDDYLPSEYEVSLHELEMLRRTSSVVGQFVSEDPVFAPQTMPAPAIVNDCGGSSKSLAYSLLYALGKMGGTGVALATDFTNIKLTSPRFGDNACWGMSVLPEQNKKRLQDHRVTYTDESGSSQDSLIRYHMQDRPYDFNNDGLANYGLLPDLLQDLKNVQLPQSAFESLFSSAEAYLRTWEKAERVAGLSKGRQFTPVLPDCEVACAGRCPDSPNAGAPRPPVAKTKR